MRKFRFNSRTKKIFIALLSISLVQVLLLGYILYTARGYGLRSVLGAVFACIVLSVFMYAFSSMCIDRMMDTLKHLSSHDPLTNLPNRQLFGDMLERELSHASQNNEKLAIAVMDIDKFDNINNTLGHEIGDKLLNKISEALREFIGDNGVISRMGEDKFAILIPDVCNEKNAIKTVHKLMQIIKKPWIIDGNRIYSTAGVGIAFYPGDGVDGHTLFKNAYAAMQKAKKTSRDNYQLYDPSNSKILTEQLLIDNYMHNALENNEFTLYYQPQMDLKTGEIIGTEALLRWFQPELGYIPPDKFIPIAEETGLIIEIGEWVLYNACIQNKKWQEAGLKPVYVSVNISALQLKQTDFVEKVADVLQYTGLKPEYLELEITERVAMGDTDFVIRILDRLKLMGIRIAIDDFGTGYSSLNYLKNFSITTLKIDRSFVSELIANPKDAAIVSAILAIGHNLNLSVTAEGVETQEQMSILQSKNCDAAQGYLFYKPVEAEAMEKLLLNSFKQKNNSQVS